MKTLYGLVFLFIFSSCSTFTGQREVADTGDCSDLITNFFIRKESDILSSIEKKLKNTKYFIQDSKLFLKNPDGTSDFLGAVETLNVRFMFEWQDEASHNEWIKDGGITKESMDYILKQKAQNHGRGYYISTHPIDSMMYGNYLTIFEVNEPMIVLSRLDKRISDNEKALKELRRAGFAGIKGTETWYSIINEKYLLGAKRSSDKVMAEILDPSNNVPAFDISGFLHSGTTVNSTVSLDFDRSFRAKYSKEAVFKKIAEGKPIDKFEGYQIINAVAESPKDFSKEYKDPKMYKYFFENISVGDLSSFIAPFLHNRFWYDTNLATMQKVFSKIPLAESFFNLFDLFDLAALGKKGIAGNLSYKGMMEEAIKFDANIKLVDFTKVESAADFSQAFKKVFDSKLEVRSEEVSVMAFDNHSKKIVIEDSNGRDYYKTIPFLSITKTKRDEEKNLIELYARFTGASNLEKLKPLFTASEFLKIQSFEDKNEATKYALDKLLKIFFDPTKFEKLKLVYPHEGQTTAQFLYKTFLALHPYKENNEKAAKLYYRWLATNFYKDRGLNPKNLIDKVELFYPHSYYKPTEDFSWYATRLWVLAAKDEDEVIKRSRLILSKESTHVTVGRNMPGLTDYLIP